MKLVLYLYFRFLISVLYTVLVIPQDLRLPSSDGSANGGDQPENEHTGMRHQRLQEVIWYEAEEIIENGINERGVQKIEVNQIGFA